MPKFGSFKPRTTTQAGNAAKDVFGTETSRHHRHTSRRARHTRRSNDNGREAEARREEHGRLHTQDPTSGRVADRSLSEVSDLFVVDTQGDPYYGNVDSRSARKSHCREQGSTRNVIACHRNVRIERTLRTESSPLNIPVPHLDDSPELEEAIGGELDFVALPDSLKRKRGSSEKSKPTANGDRSIESVIRLDDGTLLKNEGTSRRPSLVVPSRSDVTAAEARNEQASLRRKVEAERHDIAAWRALIELQEVISYPGLKLSELTRSQRLALADVRLALYKEAFTIVPREIHGYESLLLGYMTELSLCCEPERLSQKWLELLRDNLGSVDLWARYLDLIQTNHVDFSYERRKKRFLDAFGMLRDDSGGPLEKQDAVKRSRVYVLLRFAVFVKQAGYDEVAYSIWQAAFELQYFRPGELDRSAAKDEFEAFWDSDVPRIGEEQATGWVEWKARTRHSVRVPQTASQTPEQVENQLARLAKSEITLSKELFLPAAADDEIEALDPFRHVLSADLTEIVECMFDPLPGLTLTNAFLRFMQLPLIQDRDGGVSNLEDDLLVRDRQGTSAPAWEVDQPDGVKWRVQSWQSTTWLLFSSFPQTLQTHPQGARFAARILESLALVMPGADHVAEYFIAFKLRYFPDEATKDAKRLLRARPTSLRLYNAYALCEANHNRPEKAQKTWSIALAMNLDPEDPARADRILLWHSRTLTLVRQGLDEEALRHLIALPGSSTGVDHPWQDTTSAGQRLRALRYLREEYDRLVLTGGLYGAILCLDCLAWLTYLLEDHSLIHGIQIFDESAASFKHNSGSQGLEDLHQCKARLMQIHLQQKRPYRPETYVVLLSDAFGLKKQCDLHSVAL